MPMLQVSRSCTQLGSDVHAIISNYNCNFLDKDRWLLNLVLRASNTETFMSAKLQEMYCVAFQHKQVLYGTIQGGFLQCKQELSGAGRRFQGVICHKNDWSHKNVWLTISPWVLFNIYPSLGATREEDEASCVFVYIALKQTAGRIYNKDD